MSNVKWTASTCCCAFLFVSQMVPSENHEEESQVSVNGKRSKPEDAGGEGEYHPAKLSRRDLYKPPTAEELNQLKEAESLFHCSLLKMQVRPPERRQRRQKHLRSSRTNKKSTISRP